jgi:hypothetical protein
MTDFSTKVVNKNIEQHRFQAEPCGTADDRTYGEENS